MRLAVRAVLVTIAAAHAIPVAAQDQSHWGIGGSFVPHWEFLQFIEDSMERNVEMDGADLTVGVIRGRPSGSEWGISFVQRRIQDDSVVVQQETLKCVSRAGLSDVCARGAFHLTRDAKMTGVQAHRFFAIGRIANRVQIGGVLSGGIARLRGQAAEVREHLQVAVNPASGATSITVASESSIVEASEIFDDTGLHEYVPIGGIEAAVAVVIAPGTKLRFGAGVNFPGFHVFSVTAQYFFGR
jgi:hypothetical protein